jgi:hypothetical protein
MFSVFLSDEKNTRTAKFNTGLARFIGLKRLTENADRGNCSYLDGKVSK